MGGKRPITRNLTDSFIQQRQDKKHKAAQRLGYDSVPGGTSGTPQMSDRTGSAAGSSFKRDALPPEWVDTAEACEDELKTIRDGITQLKKAQSRRLKDVFSDSPDAEIEAVSNDIVASIRRAEACIHKVRTRGATGQQKDDEFRVNMQKKLAAELNNVSKQYREAQKNYLEEIRKRQPRGAGDLDAQASSSSPSGARGGSGQLLAQEIDDMEGIAAQRSSEIANIARSMNDLQGMFKELAALVIDQGSVLDRIDFNMEQMVQKGQKTNQHLQKTVKAKKKADDRALKCILCLCSTNSILLLILLIKWKIKYGWSFVHVLEFFFWMFAVGFAAFSVVRYRPQWVHMAFPRAAGWLLPKPGGAPGEPDQPSGNPIKGAFGSIKSAFGGVSSQLQGASAARSAAQNAGISPGIAMSGMAAGRQGLIAAQQGMGI